MQIEALKHLYAAALSVALDNNMINRNHSQDEFIARVNLDVMGRFDDAELIEMDSALGGLAQTIVDDLCFGGEEERMKAFNHLYPRTAGMLDEFLDEVFML